MKINFEITDIPKGEQKKYPTAYLEGILKIYVYNNLFFNQPGVLLIELAIFINKWLKSNKKGEGIDFLYESMDSEEPILSFYHLKDNYYRIYSVWQENKVTKLIKKQDLVLAFEEYLNNLDKVLKSCSEIELNGVLQVSRL